MELKFDIGMALIEAVREHRGKFVRDNLADPEKALKVVMSYAAYSAVMLSLAGQNACHGKIDLKAFCPPATIMGIPVVVDDDVRIMDIRRVG